MTASFARGSDTSREAARSLSPDALTKLETKVFEFIRDRGPPGATCEEIELHTTLPHQTASARVNGLMNKGRIADSGQRRKTRSGRRATVWVVQGSMVKQLSFGGVGKP